MELFGLIPDIFFFLVGSCLYSLAIRCLVPLYLAFL